MIACKFYLLVKEIQQDSPEVNLFVTGEEEKCSRHFSEICKQFLLKRYRGLNN